MKTNDGVFFNFSPFRSTLCFLVSTIISIICMIPHGMAAACSPYTLTVACCEKSVPPRKYRIFPYSPFTWVYLLFIFIFHCEISSRFSLMDELCIWVMYYLIMYVYLFVFTLHPCPLLAWKDEHPVNTLRINEVYPLIDIWLI